MSANTEMPEMPEMPEMDEVAKIAEREKNAALIAELLAINEKLGSTLSLKSLLQEQEQIMKRLKRLLDEVKMTQKESEDKKKEIQNHPEFIQFHQQYKSIPYIELKKGMGCFKRIKTQGGFEGVPEYYGVLKEDCFYYHCWQEDTSSWSVTFIKDGVETTFRFESSDKFDFCIKI